MIVFVLLWTTDEIEMASLNPPMASIDIIQGGASALVIRTLGMILR